MLRKLFEILLTLYIGALAYLWLLDAAYKGPLKATAYFVEQPDVLLLPIAVSAGLVLKLVGF